MQQGSSSGGAEARGKTRRWAESLKASKEAEGKGLMLAEGFKVMRP